MNVLPFAITLSFLLLALAAVEGAEPAPLLAQRPTVNEDQIVFVFADDLWTVPRTGGQAMRLTSDIGAEMNPFFSPDGRQLAFTGEYDGNFDVFVMPASGGTPRRLTHHPDADRALGWTSDGSEVLFSSPRGAPHGGRGDTQMFVVSTNGGFPKEIPLPRANFGSFSPDGKQMAYMPFDHFQRASWRRYRGGMMPRIWLADLDTSRIEELPREKSNDFNPMWVGENIYFLSDRNGPVNLFAYDVTKRVVEEVLPNRAVDIKTASAGFGAIVYEEFGAIHLYDLTTRKSSHVPIRITADMPLLRAHFKTITRTNISNVSLSPAGARMLFEAHGDILSAPAEKGDIRNLSNTPGVMERDPAWSPDGKWIAYFSDASGEYELCIVDRDGQGERRKIPLGEPPTYYLSAKWSPDSKHIVYQDKRLNLWWLDVESGVSTKIDTSLYDGGEQFSPGWSPDSKYVAYTRSLSNHFHTVFIYAFETRKSHQVGDGLSDARHPRFDRSGKYLYFSSSTDLGMSVAGNLSMAGSYQPVTRNVYVCVLDKDLPSPVAPEQDEDKEPQPKKESGREENEAETGKTPKQEEKATGKAKAPPAVKIDFDRIDQRIVALPIPARRYAGLWVGKENILFLSEAEMIPSDEPIRKTTIHRFDLTKRKPEKVLEEVTAFDVSANGEKLLYNKGNDWLICAATEKPEGKSAKLDGLAVYVDPRAGWQQMYHETWRIQRDFLYDPGYHGLNLEETERKYLPYLSGVASRSDLNYLFKEMLSELTLGHVYIQGGDIPEGRKMKAGLLGADYRIENGRYRIVRIYSGENWSPGLSAPLTQPGVNIETGDYLLAVRGLELTAKEEIHRLFEGTAGQSISIKVGANPDGSGARDVTVIPIESEASLRNLSWIADNRRRVSEMSGGRLAYVYIPNTAAAGYRSFNRYFFAQADKEGAILDERYNAGGKLADYIIDALRRPIMSYRASREGLTMPFPVGSIFGPKVMIINESAGSGGDAMPWYFRKAGIGKLVGTRTWGGLVGIGGYPALMDGGRVTAPRFGIYGLDGEWEVENVGIDPDIQVQLDPKAWREGRDTQLEAAVKIALKELEENPIPKHRRPAYPNYHKRGAREIPTAER